MERDFDECNLDFIVDNLVIAGDVNSVSIRFCFPRSHRRFRHSALCRQGLGRQGARQTLNGAYGRKGHAGQCRDRAIGSRGIRFLL